MPDSAMTEMKELPSDKEHLLDDIRATVGDPSWFPDASQLVTRERTLPTQPACVCVYTHTVNDQLYVVGH